MEKDLQIAIKGMHCAACSARIERVVSGMDGVVTASVNLATEQGRFVFDGDLLTAQDIRKRIEQLGFSSEKIVSRSESAEQQQQQKERDLTEAKRTLIWELVLVVPLLLVSMGEMMGLPLPAIIAPHTSPFIFALLQFLLASAIMLLGRKFYLVGIPALIRKSPNMDSLIAVGTGAAFIYSCWNLVEIAMGIAVQEKVMDLYFESAGVLIALVSLGKYLELRSKNKSSDAIRMLMQRAPKEAVVMRDGRHITIQAKDICKGDVLLIRPGTQVPADGRVQGDGAVLDESLLTGESLPVTKSDGDPVYGGTVNSHNAFTMIAEQTGDETLLAGIIRMVSEAQGSKPNIARIADRVSFYFVPAVMALAVITGISWYVFGDVGFSTALRFFIAVMVIACPCAMGLATPISVMVGTGRGAQLGILVKNGETLELMEKTDVLLFDKTGTITEGQPAVERIEAGGEMGGDRLIALVAAVERLSEHPLAKAIVSHCEQEKIEIIAADDVENFPGRGLLGVVAGQQVVIGNRAFCAEHVAEGEISVSSENGQGKTVLFVAVDGRFAGTVMIADRVKPEAADVISSLKKRGITPVMLTGDAETTAHAVAAEVGIDEVIAGVLPERKAQVVTEQQALGKCVVMVGDGINDAPALAQADVGIAMGTGIDIAMESGDAVIMRGELGGVLTAIELSRAVMKNIRQNLFWAFGYNVVGIPIAAGLLFLFGGPQLNPMIAGGAMALSSVSVVSNALRLRFFQR